MKTLWRIILSVVFLNSVLLLDASSLPEGEVLKYSIYYKWGLVHKKAGIADLTLRNKDNRAFLKLTARSLPWVDKFFTVRDTLVSVAEPNHFFPYIYEKSTHEGGYVSHDKLKFAKRGSATHVDVEKYKIDKNGKRSESRLSLTASGIGFDMLSVFYYLRTFDYSSMQKGKHLDINIFSGKQVESLKIISEGKVKIKLLSNRNVDSYKLNLSFSRGGKKKSSDDITVWISADSKKIPLYLVGKLRFGEVRVYYDS